jgi:hypothetical protein
VPHIFGIIGAFLASVGGASIAATSTTAILIGETVVLTAASIGLGFVERALLGRPKIPSLAGQQAQQITSRIAISPWPVAYGRSRIGGTVTYLSVTGTTGEFLNVVITLTGHLIDSIPAMYFDGVAVPLNGSGDCVSGNFNGLVHAEFNLGTATQVAFAGLVAADSNWSTNCRQLGRAGAYVKLKYSADKFPNGLPNITFDLKGALFFDPRTGNTSYFDGTAPAGHQWIGENPALAIRDYLTNTKYGLGCSSGEIDDTTFITAANACDELVPLKSGGNLSGGGTQRYLCNGVVTTDQKPADILEQLLSSMAGYLTWQGGKWRVYAGVWRGPATVTLTDDDLRAPVQVQVLASRSELCNRVTGGIINATTGTWQPMDFAPYAEDSKHGFSGGGPEGDQWLVQDNGERIERRIALPFTIDSPMAQRLAKIYLERIRRQMRATWPCKITAYQLQPADVVQITRSRYSWVSKTFEIVQAVLSFQPDDQGVAVPAVDLSLRETDSGVYAWNGAVEELADPSPGTVTLPAPLVVGAPSSLVLSTVVAKRSDGLQVTLLKATWTAPTDQMVLSNGRIVVLFRVHGVTPWTLGDTVSGNIVQAYIEGLDEGTIYDVQIYSVSVANVTSATVEVDSFTLGSNTAYFTGGSINNSVGKNLLGNPGGEQNTSLTPVNTALALNVPCGDDWFVSELGEGYFEVFLDNTSPRSGGVCWRIRLKNGSVPSDNTNHESRVVTLSKIPIAIDDIVRISGWRRWDNNAAIPAGVTISQVLDCIIYAADNTEIGYIGNAPLTNSIQATYQNVQASLQIPATMSGKAPSYIRVRLLLQITNNSGSNLTTTNGTSPVYADVRFDDLKLVIQNTAFDLTPINTASTFTTTTSPLSQSGATTTILVASSTAQFADGQVSYNSGSVNPGSLGTWYVYADDPTFAGGAVTYVATATPSTTVANNGRVYFGKITTTGGGSVTGTGGGTGGGGPRGKDNLV